MGGPVQNSTFVASVVGGIMATVFWAANTYWLSSHPIPGDIASGLTVAIMALVAHFVPDTQPAAPQSGVVQPKAP